MEQAKKVTKKKVSKVTRVMKDERELYHDLFRLNLATAKKNVSWESNRPRWEMVQHQHFFHSFDSNGRPQKYASPIAGHTHEVTWEEVDGVLKATVGPAVKKAHGKYHLVEGDDHTHDAEYLFSETITARKMNAQAQAEIAKASVTVADSVQL